MNKNTGCTNEVIDMNSFINMTKTEVIIATLDKYKFDRKPIHSGFGLEVYVQEHNKRMSQLLVNWSLETITVNVIN